MGRPIDEIAADDPLRIQFNPLHEWSVWVLFTGMTAALLAFFIISNRKFGVAKSRVPLLRVMTIAFCLSLSIETIQFFSRFIGSLRAVDIDDVLLNTLGACLGYAVYRYVVQKRVKGVKGQG